ncbi:coupling factor for flagellin transcription and translation [Bacillus tianshenii]|nr:coupling factor for flagellin transcription and translation [Bacillus tianshenii]
MAFALTASFLLHFITIFIIILLSMRLNNMKHTVSKQEELQKEVEDVFSSYMVEIKEENEKLLQALRQKSVTPTQAPSQSEPAKPAGPSSPQLKPSTKAVSRVYDLNKKVTEKPRSTQSSEKKEDYTVPLSKGNEHYVQSLTSKAVQLEKQGHTVEEIAQKLNKGKTEIELLLKFRREN